MSIWRTLLDRTAVLFLGVAAGVAIGYAFGRSEGGGEQAALAPPSVQAPAPGVQANAGPAAQNAPTAPSSPSTPSARPQAAPPERDFAAPFSPRLLSTVAQGRRVRVGVFGDSYGDGIWSALYRELPAKRNYEVVKLSQQSTGFTRYGSLNLENHLREQLAGAPVDIAVISFGANDTQGVMHGGHAARLLSPEWQQVIGDRVAGFVRILREQGAMVYWVGLPKMRKPSYDADITGMNAFYAAKMRELGVPWIDTLPLSVGPDGEFELYLPDGPSQERKLMRANDGIHMSMAGYVRITRGLTQRIEAYVAAARRQAGVAAPAEPRAAATGLAGAGPTRPARASAPVRMSGAAAASPGASGAANISGTADGTASGGAL